MGNVNSARSALSLSGKTGPGFRIDQPIGLGGVAAGNVNSMETSIPSGFWKDLKAEQLIDPSAPEPVQNR